MNRHSIALFTDGASAYTSLFLEFFGVPFERNRDTHSGRRPKVYYSIPFGLAHVQIIRKQAGNKLESFRVFYRHNSRQRT